MLDAYEKEGFDVLLKAFNEPKFLESLTGLDKLYDEGEAALEPLGEDCDAAVAVGDAEAAANDEARAYALPKFLPVVMFEVPRMGLVELIAFWYVPLPSTSTTETIFHLFWTMSG